MILSGFVDFEEFGDFVHVFVLIRLLQDLPRQRHSIEDVPQHDSNHALVAHVEYHALPEIVLGGDE